MAGRLSNWTIFYVMLASVAAFVILAFDVSGFTVVLAVVAGAVIFRIGIASLQSLAQPVPEPPPAGELRKVKIQFRCEICGTEVRMTAANDEMPEAPRHCLEDMTFVAPTFE